MPNEGCAAYVRIPFQSMTNQHGSFSTHPPHMAHFRAIPYLAAARPAGADRAVLKTRLLFLENGLFTRDSNRFSSLNTLVRTRSCDWSGGGSNNKHTIADMSLNICLSFLAEARFAY